MLKSNKLKGGGGKKSIMSPLSCDVPVLSILSVSSMRQLKIKEPFYCHSAAQLTMLLLYVFLQRTTDFRVPMRIISSSRWFL